MVLIPLDARCLASVVGHRHRSYPGLALTVSSVADVSCMPRQNRVAIFIWISDSAFSAGRLQTSEKHLNPSHVCCKGRNLKFRDLRNTWRSNGLYTLCPTGAVSFTKKRKEKEEDTKCLWSYLSCGYCCHSCTMQIYSCLASSSVSLVELSFAHCRTACQAVISFSICTQIVRHQIKPPIRVRCIVQRYSIGVR